MLADINSANAKIHAINSMQKVNFYRSFIQLIESHLLKYIHDFSTLSSHLFARVYHREWFEGPGFVFSILISNFPEEML